MAQTGVNTVSMHELERLKTIQAVANVPSDIHRYRGSHHQTPAGSGVS